MIMKVSGGLILWEILVPSYYNNGKKVPLSYHKAWDREVAGLSKGLTVMRPARGSWVPGGHRPVQKEQVIPVRFIADEDTAKVVLSFTRRFYQQQESMMYVVSSHILLEGDHEKEDLNGAGEDEHHDHRH
jgi:hypothetical protein